MAALGFGDIPVRVFAEAFNLVDDGGWVAFNIKETFLDERDTSGFSVFIKTLILSEYLDIYGGDRNAMGQTRRPPRTTQRTTQLAAQPRNRIRDLAPVRGALQVAAGVPERSLGRSPRGALPAGPSSGRSRAERGPGSTGRGSASHARQASRSRPSLLAAVVG